MGMYFYFLCRGRQVGGVCDLPYLHISKVERVVENHYATVQLAEDFCARLRARLEATRSATATTNRLREQLGTQLTKLDAQEDRYLDLVGDPDWPKEKLSAKMRSIREERARVQERLSQADSPIDSGCQVLEMALQLLSNPLALYQAAKQRTRKVINKTIFTKLYVDADPEGPYVASEELNEPSCTPAENRVSVRLWNSKKVPA